MAGLLGNVPNLGLLDRFSPIDLSMPNPHALSGRQARQMSHQGSYSQGGEQAIADEAERRRQVAIQEEYFRLQATDPVRFASLPPLDVLLREPSAFDAAMARWTGPDEAENVTNVTTDVLGSQFAGGLIPAAKQVQTSGLLSMLDPRMSPGQLNAGARMSRAEAEAAGYWHPISSTRLQRPFQDITVDRFPDSSIQVPPRDFILPESLEGNVIIPATGDRTAAAMYLSGINNIPFEQAVKLSGGPDFMRTHGSSLNPDLSTIWAAAPGVTKQLYDKARYAADQGMDSALMYMPMSYRSSDFSTMMADSLIEQMKAGKITKKLKREFDNEVREVRPEWKGVDHPESREQLHSRGSGELRKALIKKMGLKKYQQGGFPELGSTRMGIMEPGLIDTPSYAGGFSIGRLDPTRAPTMDHPMPHASYPSQVHGNYLGGFEVPLPLEILYPDFIAARRAAGKPQSKDIRAFQFNHPVQEADAQWVDRAMRYTEANR